MNKRPVLFHRIHEWDYDQFIAGCKAEAESLDKRFKDLEAMTDEAFTKMLSDLGVQPLRSRQSDLEKVHLDWYQIIHKDLHITPEAYAALKKEADIDAKKMRDLAMRGMQAIELARELEAYGFWKNANPGQMSALPLNIQIFDFDLTDLNKIKTAVDLSLAVKIVRKHFSDFKINRVVVKAGTNKFQAYIYSLKKVWTIAKTLSDMHKAGVISAIS